MRHLAICVLVSYLGFCPHASGQSGAIKTGAAKGNPFSGDRKPAASELGNTPTGAAVDASGDVFIADSGNSRIRELSAPAPALSVRDGSDVPNARIVEAYGKLPLSFEANQGQADAQVKFLSRGNGYTLFLTSKEAVLSPNRSPGSKGAATRFRLQNKTGPLAHARGSVGATEEKPAVLRMKLVGANSAAQVTGLEELPGKSNYFIGNDPAKWRTNVPTYARVRYENVYSGIDLVYYGNRGKLEFDFVVAPGADPRGIRLAFPARDSNGAVPLRMDRQGDLLLGAEGSEILLHRPVVYQEINGARKSISGNFVIQGEAEIGFEIARYDASKPLIVDPVLAYSTYLGGSSGAGGGAGTAIAVDSSGNAYVTGSDAFVTKLNASGSAVVYSTHLGGSCVNSDGGSGVAVDSSGNAYVTGATCDTDFPVASAFQATNRAAGSCAAYAIDGLCGYNAFVTKLNATGSALLYSTYLGGSIGDSGASIAVDSSGNAYVTGTTTSTNFPTANAFQAAFGSSSNPKLGTSGSNAFVTKLNSIGSALVYSTYLGGSAGDGAKGIAVDSSGSAYVTGITSSTNFPTTANAFQSSNSIADVDFDGFVTKLNADGSALVYSTFLGGVGTGIAVDSTGNAYIAGTTPNSYYGFTTVNAYQAAGDPTDAAFVVKLNADGSEPVYATYLGTTPTGGVAGSEWSNAIAVDSFGNAYVTGLALNLNFPTANAFQATYPIGSGGTAFVTELNATGSALLYSTYLGGGGGDSGNGIAVDSTGSAYVTGYTFTRATNFPTTPNAFQSSSVDEAAFVTKFPAVQPGPAVALSTANFLFSYKVEGGTPAGQPLRITNSGSGTLAWTAVSSASWLKVTPASGTAPSSVTVSVVPPATDDAFYTGTITIFAAGAPEVVAQTVYVFLAQAALLTSLSPATATAGGSGFMLTVTGLNSSFVPGQVVEWNGSPRATAFAGNSQLVAYITASDIATAGTAQVAVVNPAPGSGASTNALTFTITQPTFQSQTITFGPFDGVVLGVAPFAITATASSGLTVAFSSTTPSVCTVAGTTVTIVAAGTCSITASQAGNAAFAAATPVIQSFAVISPGLALQLVTVAPCRVMDTRLAKGPLGGPSLAAGTTRAIPIPSGSCGVPANAMAYALNFTVVPGTDKLGSLTVWPTGESQPLVQTLTSPDGSVLASAAIVPAGTAGSINAYVTDETDLIVDINGYFVPPAASTLQFYPLPPCRVLDTRQASGTFGGPTIAGGTSRSFPIASSSCGAPASAAAYSLNVTVVPPGYLGYLTTWPTGQAQPYVSTMNAWGGTVIANAAIVPAGTGGAVSFFASEATDVVVDINGYFAPPGANGLNFYTVVPCRLVDTRKTNGTFGGPTMSGYTTRNFPLSEGSCGLPGTPALQAYSLSVSVVPQGVLPYLTIWPAGVTQPVVSTLNAWEGQAVSNAALVPAGTGGSVSVFVTNTTDVIIDTAGFFGP